jgi:hypothetical protein
MSTAHPFVLGFGTANESHETRGSGVGELTPARLVSEGYTPDAISGRCGLVEGSFSPRLPDSAWAMVARAEGYTPDAISGRCGLVEGSFSPRLPDSAWAMVARAEGYTPDAISGRCGLVEGPFSCRPCRTLTVRFVLKDTTPFFFNATLLLCFPHRAGNKWIGK